MQHNPKRYDPAKARELVKRLTALTDPLALSSWIGKKTGDGDRPGPEPWTYTRAYFADYGTPDWANHVAELFAAVGVQDEVDASVWLAEHTELIP